MWNVIGLLMVVVVITALANQPEVKEGYQSLTNCLDQGYPHDFCMNVPIQSVISDGYCNCTNGQLGTYVTAHKCSCFAFNPQAPYYTEKVFRDYLA